MSIDKKDYINIRIYFGHLYFIYGLCGFNGAIMLFIEIYFSAGISFILKNTINICDILFSAKYIHIKLNYICIL